MPDTVRRRPERDGAQIDGESTAIENSRSLTNGEAAPDFGIPVNGYVFLLDPETGKQDGFIERDKVPAGYQFRPVPLSFYELIDDAAPQTVRLHTGSASFIDEVCNRLKQRSWLDVLGSHDWQHHHDADGVSYWTRPGKDPRLGHSATTNATGSDRLIVFSSATQFESWDGTGPAPSFDRLDVIAMYEYGGIENRVAAARALADQFGIARSSSTPPAEIVGSRNLPDEFWNARPALAQIRQAALSRMISPDAVCGAVLARTAALSHHRITLPPIVGRVGSPDLYFAVLAGPSFGKGASMDTAKEMMPSPPELGSWIAGRFVESPVGSGEGIVKLFFDVVPTYDANGKRVGPARPKQTAWNALIRIDEVESLERLSKRQDQTTMSILRSAWSREMLGPAYADAEKNLRLQPGMYRLGVVMGVQPSAAGFLLDDHGTGTPQRFVFVSGMHPDVSDADVPDFPGPLQWQPIRLADTEQGQLDVASSIVSELRARHVAVVTGKVNEPLQAHSGLRQLKVAAALAMLDSRPAVNDEDWQLAALFAAVGDACRDRLRNDLQRERHLREQATDERAGRRRLSELHAEEQAAEQRIVRGAQVLVNRLRTVGQPMAWRRLRNALGSRYARDDIEIRAYAADNGLIVEQGDGTWAIGERP